MKHAITVLLACVVCGVTSGGLVTQPFRMQFLSDNQRFMMEIIPRESTKAGEWKQFESICYATAGRGSGRLVGGELWRSKGWYSYTCYLSNDGRSVVQIDQITRDGFERLIRFYRDGVEVAEFAASDVVPKLKDFGPFETRHWLYGDAIRPEEEALRARFSNEHQFRFRTVDEVNHMFDFATFTLDGRKPNRVPGSS